MIVEWAVRRKFLRNENHAIWFIMSIWLFVTSLGHFMYPEKAEIFLLPVIVHTTAFMQAMYIRIKNEISLTLSADCIWFNALMGVVYLVLFTVVKFN